MIKCQQCMVRYRQANINRNLEFDIKIVPTQTIQRYRIGKTCSFAW